MNMLFIKHFFVGFIDSEIPRVYLSGTVRIRLFSPRSVPIGVYIYIYIYIYIVQTNKYIHYSFSIKLLLTIYIFNINNYVNNSNTDHYVEL